MEAMIIGVVFIGLVLLILFGKTLKLFRLLGQAIIKIAIGALLLFLLNLIGSNFDLHVPINFITAAISGFLGIPGVLALAVIEVWII